MKKIITLFAFCAILCACDKDKYSLSYYYSQEDIDHIGEEIEWEPEANFDVTSNLNCQVVFYDLCIGIKMSYDFGDGCSEDYYPKEGTKALNGSNRQIKHTYAKKKTYKVTVTSYNDKGKSATCSKDVTVR